MLNWLNWSPGFVLSAMGCHLALGFIFWSNGMLMFLELLAV